MICAISPSSDNYDETMSTLRYADQAKKIKCNAKVNESEQEKMIRNLKGENEKLKLLLNKLVEDPTSVNLQVLAELKSDLESNALLMNNLSKDDSENLNRLSKPNIQKKDEYSQRLLVNLNEDEMLNFKIKFKLNHNQIIGKDESNIFDNFFHIIFIFYLNYIFIYLIILLI